MEDILLNENFKEILFDRAKILSPTQQMLLRLLQQKGPLTRRELVNQLNTPRTTLYDNLIKLQKRKVIEKFTRNNGSRGRPLVYWKLV